MENIPSRNMHPLLQPPARGGVPAEAIPLAQPRRILGAAAMPKQEVSLASMLRRRWKWLSFATLLSVAAGWYAATYYASNSWQYETKLLYSPLMAAHPDYVPPDLNTLADLFTSQDLVAALRSEFAPEAPPRRVVAAMATRVPYGSSTLAVRLTWHDPELAEKMLTRAVGFFRADVARVQKLGLDRCVDDFQVGLVRSDRNLQEAKNDVDAFNRKHRIVDIKKDMQDLQADIRKYAQELAMARSELDNCQAQLDRLTSLSSSDAKDTEEAAENGRRRSAAMAGFELEKRTFLKELIQNEKDRVSTEVQLELLAKEYKRAKALHEKQYISQAEFEKIEAQYNTLLTLERDKDVQRWHGEVARIEQRMPDLLKSHLRFGGSDPKGLAQLATDLELQMVAAEGKVACLEQVLAQQQGDLQRLQTVRREALELDGRVQMALGQRHRVATRLAELKQLQASTLDAFTEVQPIRLALDGVQSNAKKLFVLGFALCGMVLGAPVLLLELAAHRERPLDRAARQLGLPVLARDVVRPTRRVAKDEPRRLLALRIQQSAAAAGSVVLFSSINRKASVPKLLTRLAECLAKRGERILLVDVAHQPKGRPHFEGLLPCTTANGNPNNQAGSKGKHNGRCPGIADYLADNRLSPDELIQSTCLQGVDCLLPGRAAMPSEALATKGLTELLQKLREKYGLVLLAGPSAANTVDLELLAARADGIVFVTWGKGTCFPGADEAVANLVELNAPIWGVVG